MGTSDNAYHCHGNPIRHTRIGLAIGEPLPEWIKDQGQ